MNRPVTKEDVERLNQSSKYLVPLKQYREQRDVMKELKPVELSAERLALVEDKESATECVRKTLQAMLTNRK
jgi:hypothetical protein